MTTYRYLDPAVIHEAAKRGDHVYPFASYQPLPEAATQPAISPWSYILHTMAGPGTTTPTQLRKYLAREDVKGECHLGLGYTELQQWVPFNVRADNNAKANSWFVNGQRVGAISVETQDNGSTNDPGIAKAPWNPFQVEHLAGTAAFLNLRYGIPIARCPRWDSRGVDGHRAHDEWSVYVGKTCPGQTRWGQIPSVLILAAEIVAWRPTPPDHTGDPDMAKMNVINVRWNGYADVVTGFHTSAETLALTGAIAGEVVVLPKPDATMLAKIERELGHKLTPL
jgi:hypothetical protein